MSRVKFTLVFPALQLCTALVLHKWENHVYAQVQPKHEFLPVTTATLVYRGLNAPALLFTNLCVQYLPIYRVDQRPGSLFGVSWDELLFIAASICMWVIVGMALDRRIKGGRVFETNTRLSMAVSMCIAAFGVLTLYGGLLAIARSGLSPNPTGQLVEGILFLAWSVTLIIPLVLRLRTLLYRPVAHFNIGQ